ncbi:MAG: hypothetical protein ACQEQE_07085 [Bacillota bacterium]
MEFDLKLLHRKDLDAYEKMIIMLISIEQKEKLDDKYFLNRLGCSKIDLKKAFKNLVSKGILENKNRSKKIIKQDKDSKKLKLDNFDKELDKIKITKKEKISKIYKIIREPINERQVNILFNFAKGDIDLIEEKYNLALKSQVSDKLGFLMKELQSADNKKIEKNNKKSKKVKKQNGDKNKKRNMQINKKALDKYKKMNKN